MTKITKREKYEMIIATLTKDELTAETSMLVDFCKAEIDALDRKAAKAKERKAAKEAEEDSVYNAIWDVLQSQDEGSFVTIPTILTAIGDENLTPSKITPRLTSMINEGIVEKKTVVTGDKRRLNGYAIVRA